MKLEISILLFLCTLIMSCDYESSIEYEIDNQTDDALNIETAYNFFPRDTNYISSQTQFTLFISDGIGATTKNRMKGIEAPPFEEIIITNQAGKTFQPDPIDLENWEANYPAKRDGLVGTFKLTVRAEDFE